ncbi:hypothetical protein jhhlp_001889 [Lomentospora prolificans]|uniref:Major facilitator superfamily (MFS) profile domain-containing protein n=1 Tax=Lomentospora prolificans TaxID=41688 RepID=A0A2N3NCJ0_9PEZI|nr:hypothetical protein jhhlp_001889 [Lomentospora prolificans]
MQVSEVAPPDVASTGDKDKLEHEPEKAIDTTHEDEEQAGYPSGLNLLFTVLALIFSIFLASLDMATIPKITDEFGGIDKVSWYGAAFFMTNGSYQTAWGKAYKFFNLKYTFLASVFVLEVGSLICALAPNPVALIVGRAVTGLGAAGIGTGAYTIIAFVAPPNKRPMYTGYIGLSYGIASVSGPLLGGVFSDTASWRWCFYVNLPIGGIAAAIIFFFFHTPKAAKPVSATWREKFLQMDPVGTTLIMGAIICFMLSLEKGGQTKPWNSGEVIGTLVGFFVITALFIAWEAYQNERAVIIPRLFMTRSVGIGSLFACFFAGSYLVVLYYMPIYFQSVGGVTPIMSGVRNIPLIIAVTVAMIVSGAFISATNCAIPVLIGGAALATVGAGLIYTLDIDSNTGKWIGYQILAGLGWGAAYQIPIIIGQRGADPGDVSSITAIVLFFQNFGGTAFVTVGQAAFANTLVNNLATAVPSVKPSTVIATGATAIRSVFDPADVPGIVQAYMAGVKVAFAIGIAAAGAAFATGMCGDWKADGKGGEKGHVEIVAAL